MFKELLKLAMKALEEKSNKETVTVNRKIELLNELEELEVKRAKEIANCRMFGITDENHFMMAEANRLKMVIEAKRATFKALNEQ